MRFLHIKQICQIRLTCSRLLVLHQLFGLVRIKDVVVPHLHIDPMKAVACYRLLMLHVDTPTCLKVSYKKRVKICISGPLSTALLPPILH